MAEKRVKIVQTNISLTNLIPKDYGEEIQKTKGKISRLRFKRSVAIADAAIGSGWENNEGKIRAARTNQKLQEEKKHLIKTERARKKLFW